MPNFNSALYLALHVNNYIADARDRGGRAVPIPFLHTVQAGEAAADTINLCVLPADCMVVDLQVVANAFGGTCTVALGDAGQVDRYMIATVLNAAAGASPALTNKLPFAGQNYRPSANTVVLATYAAAAPTVGAILKGCFMVVPGN